MSVLVIGLVAVLSYLSFIYFVLDRYGLKIYAFLEVNTFHFRYKLERKVTRLKERMKGK